MPDTMLTQARRSVKRAFSDATSGRVSAKTTVIAGPDLDGWPFVGQFEPVRSTYWANGLATTDGRKPIADIERPSMASNNSIGKQALIAVNALPDSEHKLIARSLLSSIQSCINDDYLYREMTPFTPIAFSQDLDGTIVLEWAYINGRISFYIDPVVEDSVAVFVDGLDASRHMVTTNEAIEPSSIHSLAWKSVRFVARLA